MMRVQPVGLAVRVGEHLLLQLEQHAAAQRRANSSSGSADRYRLMPHARMTISSLFFVSRPIVTSVATSAAIGMM